MQSVCAFVVQRCDCDAFAPCVDKDPEYARGVVEAAANGVLALGCNCCCSDAHCQKAAR
ncbi:MAG: DNA/RNA nuclease SfsA [Akkermansiaceae bacterium]|nr:DNA/RNA nuclease SfsA [Akkermansiaceae bacterium]